MAPLARRPAHNDNLAMQPIRSIVIVGGGTAGWLAACCLERSLAQWSGTRITLIESPGIGTIGVGESTVPSLRSTLAGLGLPEDALFGQADATLKNGIRFQGWRNGGNGAQDRYDHPFDAGPPAGGIPALHHWLHLRRLGVDTPPMSDACLVQTALFDAMRSPRPIHGPAYQAPFVYAYQLDAIKLARVLQATAVARGVRHQPGEVVGVERGGAGIAAVALADGSRHTADFFVDCTGFRALLVGHALQVPWVSYAQWLPCDRAIACPVAFASEDGPLRSYTTASAQGSGWIWDIDLQSRRGTGHVYASSWCSDDEALGRLRQYHGGARPLAEPRLLQMRVGRHARAWDHNCLALGLSGGFIEPLESTAIYLIEFALQQFIAQAHNEHDDTVCRASVNQTVGAMYEELRDFVIAHYALSGRRDTPFWRACTEGMGLPDSLRGLLADWRARLPVPADLVNRCTLFGPHSWNCILAGLDRLAPDAPDPLAGQPMQASVQALERVRAARGAAAQQAPGMREFATAMRAAPAGSDPRDH